MFQVTTNARNYRIYNVRAIFFICHSVSYQFIIINQIGLQNQNINVIIIHKSRSGEAPFSFISLFL